MKHFTLGERYEIKALLSQSLSYRAIGKQMHKSPSTINERSSSTVEAKRITIRNDHRETIFNNANERRISLMLEMQEAITQALEQQYSPEQITERRKKEFQVTVSHERIYQFVYQNKSDGGVLYLKFALATTTTKEAVQRKRQSWLYSQ